MQKFAAALSALLCASAIVATAASAAPLNQYVVTGVNPKVLAEGGFDRTEASVPGKPGTYIVVATPAKANELRGKGASVNPLHGVTRHGGPREPRVARRSSTRPTATTCSAPGASSRLPARDLLDPRHPAQDLVPQPRSEVPGAGQGDHDRPDPHRPADHRLQGHEGRAGASVTAAGRRSCTTRRSTRGSGSPPRSSGACSPGTSRTATTVRSGASSPPASCGSSRS